MENKESPKLEDEKVELTQNNKNWYSHPYWAVIAIIASITTVIGFFLSIYFYYESKEYPELTFTIHPVRAILLQKGQTSKLSASFEGKSIESDVSTAQIAIWNNGKKAVKSDNILNAQKNIQINTENNVPILEAKIRKFSREEIQCSVNSDQISKGVIFVSWYILEKNDGCVLQLIYEGSPATKIAAIGSIEGQNQILEIASLNRVVHPADYALLTLSISALFFLIFASINNLFEPITGKKPLSRFHIITILIILMQLLSIVYNVYTLFYIKPISPPFGFDNLM